MACGCGKTREQRNAENQARRERLAAKQEARQLRAAERAAGKKRL